MFTRIFQISFAGLLAGSMVWAAALCKMVYLLPLPKAFAEGICLMLTQIAWTSSVRLSPWISVTKQSSSDDWAEIISGLDGKERPLFLLGNHTSFFDTLLTVTKLPVSVLWKMRTYMKNDLFNFPILGTICRSVGHFPVFFKSDEEGTFKVDGDKMAGVEQQVNAHLGSGGWLCFFPEGAVNKNPDKLMPLRYGGFKKALDFDANLASFVTCGNPTIWPMKAAVGGFPGQIRYSTKILAPNGTKALAAELRKKAEDEAKTPEERENIPDDHKLVAHAVQVMMQSQYDELKVALEGKPSIKED